METPRRGLTSYRNRWSSLPLLGKGLVLVAVPVVALLATVVCSYRSAHSDANVGARLDRELSTSAVGGLGYRRAAWLVVGLLAAGETERALGLLEGLRPSRRLWDVLRFPEFDTVRSNPRFQRLVEASRPR